MNKPMGNQIQFPFLPPFEPGLFIHDIKDTHRLLFNKFPVEKNHLLVTTKEYQEQNKGLTQQDFKASALVLTAISGFAFFNSDTDAGSSQPHRHIQLMSFESMQKSSMIQYFCNLGGLEGETFTNLFPFSHFLKYNQMTDDPEILGDNLYQSYCQAKTYFQFDKKQYSYNLIFTEQFFFIALRKKEKAFDVMAVNGMGFAGSFLLKDQNQWDLFKDKDPIEILQDICY